VKVLAVMGSPRIGGNTDALVTEILRGADLSGAETERIDLIRYDVSPCTGCQDCRASGFCVIKDDAPALIDLMLESDIWVIGTPVYWWGPSGLLKAFVDRWYSTIHLPSIKKRMAKRVALACVYGDADPDTPRYVLGMFEEIVSYLGGSLTDRLLVRASSFGAARQNPDVMLQALELGRRLGAGRQ